MISMVHPLYIGNALRLFLEPPAGSVRWRVLRKGSDSFTGVDDPEALPVYDGDERVITDTLNLPNELIAFYQAFYTEDGSTWLASETASGTPRATYADQSTDALSVLRDRLEAGLRVEVERGTIVNELGYVPVFNAPPLADKGLPFPLVTLHVENDASEVRALGEDLSGSQFDAIGFDWEESEGWISQVSIVMIGWSLNPDERIALRQAINRIVIGNLSVFDAEGLLQVNLSFQDVDAVSGEFNAPVFQVMGTFSCLAPKRVSGEVSAIREVISRSITNG